MSATLRDYPLKGGKLPARAGAVKLKFADYFDSDKLPRLPDGDFGHEGLIAPSHWQMLGNEKFGCCVWAGAAHETMMFGQMGGSYVNFREENVLSDYKAVVPEFDPTSTDPAADPGTDMELAAKYRRQTGVIDSIGRRHKIEVYLALTPGDWNQHLLAIRLFGAVSIGLELPASSMDQLDAGKPWDFVAGSDMIGGHYVPGVARRGDMINTVTYGQTQLMTKSFFEKFNDESIAFLSPEALRRGKSLEGFDHDALLDDFNMVTA